jgi:hypothetical protein
MNLRDQNPRQHQKRPWASRTEMLVDEALDNALEATPDQLRAMRPVARPQNPFPERQGYGKWEMTVDQVFNIDRQFPTYRSWVSGAPVMQSVMSDQSWSGTARNSLGGDHWR